MVQLNGLVYLASTTLALVSAGVDRGRDTDWLPAGPDDFRGPCPMMNTLANHGLLPRNGRNITKENAIYALSTALNFDVSLVDSMFEQAIIANPEPNATSFTLHDLNSHNVLEHDASMSRLDAYFGNNHLFDKAVFQETTAYWTSPILTAEMLANGKLIRQINSRAINPTYTFNTKTETFSLGEAAAPIIVFGDTWSGTVNRSFVVYFFENERLPTELGWTKKAEIVSIADVLRVSEMIGNATNLITDSVHVSTVRRQDLHAGFGPVHAQREQDSTNMVVQRPV